jgi:mannose-1-phosphate guanylyltransferase/mannose-6-phosphate isomerase
MPKQLLHILGNRSMLACTLDRAMNLVPEDRVWIVTTAQQSVAIRRELQFLGMNRVRVIEEPGGRNTAAAIGLAAVHVMALNPAAVMAILPADHHVARPERLGDVILSAIGMAEDDWLVTVGIPPTKPETGYGYIHRGHSLSRTGASPLETEAYAVERFVEKPDRGTAEQYLASGEYYWNGGIFVWTVRRYMEELERHLPAHRRALDRIATMLSGARPDAREIGNLYNGMESVSVDYGIMEHAERVAVIPADMGWSDVGSWESLREVLSKDSDGNVIRGDVIADRTRNSLIHAGQRLVAVLGMEGIVVVETADAVLVCPEARSQDIKRIVEQLRAKDRPEARIHTEVHEPWGTCRVLDRGERYLVKCLDVRTGACLSCQSHEFRSEHWTVVQGTATVTLDGRVLQIHPGENLLIMARQKHRLENQGGETLRVIEVQTGSHLGEDDIVRYQDDCRRSVTDAGDASHAP